MSQKSKYLRLLFISVLFISILPGCHTYYMATRPKNGTASIDSLKAQDRFFILRNGNYAYYMKNIALSADRKTLECKLDSLPPEHQLHLQKGVYGKMQYDPEEFSVLSEVHLYIPHDQVAASGNQYTLSLDKVEKIEVIEKDKKRTSNSYVIGAIGFTLGALAVVGIIIAATKSSCPFVSAYDGEQFALQGEIYGGAIYPQLERHDYLPLKMALADNGNLQIKISNELQEKQFTDMADLLVIQHPENIRIMPDPDGKLYSIEKPEAPVTAIFSDKIDVKDLLAYEDRRLLYFDDSTEGKANNHVVLQFKKKEASQKAKLILSLKNSYWLDYLYGELAKGFGSYYTAYTKQQHKRPASELNKWTREQQIPLEVSIKSKEGWKKLRDITTVGPLAIRDMVIPIDLSAIEGSRIEIKLNCGFLFWELDYAAMDFTPDCKINMQSLQPFTAIDEKGKDVVNIIAKEDGQYLEQPVPGTVVSMEYKWKPAAGSTNAYSFILHTKGYYEHVRNFKGAVNKTFLKQFKKPGAFAAYSVQRYKQFNKQELEGLVKNK